MLCIWGYFLHVIFCATNVVFNSSIEFFTFKKIRLFWSQEVSSIVQFNFPDRITLFLFFHSGVCIQIVQSSPRGFFIWFTGFSGLNTGYSNQWESHRCYKSTHLCYHWTVCSGSEQAVPCLPRNQEVSKGNRLFPPLPWESQSISKDGSAV